MFNQTSYPLIRVGAIRELAMVALLLLLVPGMAFAMGRPECWNCIDPGCQGPNPGEGYLLSSESDCSVDERTFTSSDMLSLMMWSDLVDHTNIKTKAWVLKDASKNKVKQQFSDFGNGTFSAIYYLGSLPSNATSWTWTGTLADRSRVKYEAQTTITVNP